MWPRTQAEVLLVNLLAVDFSLKTFDEVVQAFDKFVGLGIPAGLVREAYLRTAVQGPPIR